MREDLVPGNAGDAPYFYLSYAPSRRNGGGNGPDLDYWVGQLFTDLCGQVNALRGTAPDSAVGFMDRELLPGRDWPDNLARALATCRVFVPLYSRRYFAMDHCGREWSAFALRLRGRAADAPSAVIPAVWAPVEQEFLPEAARSVPWDDAGVQPYADLGLYGIMKISRYRADYQKAVLHLAGRIVDAAASSPAIGSVLDYGALGSAFGTTARGTRGGQPLRITIVAPSLGDLPDGRGSYYYGAAARDWDPYKPDSSQALADHVADLARSLGYRPFAGDLSEHDGELANGQPPSAPEVVIVDPWAARQDKFRQQLSRLNALDRPWVQVLVPWNRRDAESTAAEAALRDALDRALHRKLTEDRATSALATRGVPTLEDLDQVLPAVAAQAARQYQRHALAAPPAGDAAERPRLSVTKQDPRVLRARAFRERAPVQRADNECA